MSHRIPFLHRPLLIDLRMNLEELFRPIHPNAQAYDDVVTRIRGALKRPEQTQYVCPSLMTASAVAYAVRGYDVYWAPVWDDTMPERHRNDAGVAYRLYKHQPDGTRFHSHGVDLRCLFPEKAIRLEMKLRLKARLLRRRFGV